MIDVCFVMDGERDRVTVPPLVERLLGVRIRANTTPWVRLHQASQMKGYQRKLRFAIIQAQREHAAALIAVVDRDKAPRQEKLNQLKAGRDQSAGFPVAIGQAEPHGEAWLLDDPVAIRLGLGLQSDVKIPNVRRVKSPKETIEELRGDSDRAGDPILQVLADITARVVPSRFLHADETGFEDFAKDVQQQLGPVARHCGEACRCGDECKPKEDVAEE